MSKINVDTWEPESGTAATLMASGDTVTLPSGAILAVASGGDINVASGGEIDIASGATLDVNGIIDLTGATKTGFPTVTDCSIWRLTTTFTGDANPIASNLEEDDGPDYVRLGSAMTESSGVFTFPSTGFWKVDFSAIAQNNVADNHVDCTIESVISTVSDSRCKGVAALGKAFNYNSTYCSTLFDCANTTTHKVQFCVNHTNTANGVAGDTNNNDTFFIFTRLADT